MSYEQVFFLFPLVAGIAFSNVTATAAEEPLIFISAFAPGEKGAIHAYKMNPQTGEFKLVERTSDVEHPFFLAASPDNKFLYSPGNPAHSILSQWPLPLKY